MLYIKLDKEGNPVNHPMEGDNLKQVLEVSYLDDATLEEHGYARFEWAPHVPGMHTEPTLEYYIGGDGVVRNVLNIRELTQKELLDKFIRARRSHLLAACDWTQSADSPLSEENKKAWADYRQQLRDLTTEYPNVKVESDVEWPTPPT